MKKILSLAAAAVLVLSLASCGGQPAENGSTAPSTEPTSSAPIEINVPAADVAKKLLDGIEYEDDLELSDETAQGNIDFISAIYDVDASLMADAAIYTSSNATPEEICVMKASSDDAVAALKTACEGRLQGRIADFTDYNPEQMPKLESAVIYTSGRYVVFSVSGSADSAKSILKDAIG